MMGGIDIDIWGNESELLIYSMQPLKDKKYADIVFNVLSFRAEFFSNL